MVKSKKKAITQFDTGAIRDTQEGKEDYVETISYSAFKRYAEYMTGKKKKYGAGNFKKGIPVANYEQSLMRHVQKYFENKYEGGTVEVNEDHLSAMCFNIFGIMHEEARLKKLSTGKKL
jgi:hypothetical protein